ncbi:aminodeoxychorismate lyase [Salinisphaera sp. SPP-AMP-43]|uniref:aminodeoxychorismate lyase n=1 Tax=Salinisphaera sp. SPP-AMP-43 TaxID=3121288 RepID=UPI003C6DD0C1
MAESCLVDGRPSDHVAADDRGLAYGDGVFRTLRLARGRPVAWAAQYARLAHDCRALYLPTPAADVVARDLTRLGGMLGPAIAKIMVTRGSSGRGYTPALQANARRIVTVTSADPSTLPDSLELERSPVAFGDQPLLAGVKHLNRLEQVLARRDCAERHSADALMCDSSGRMISTTMRNLVFADAAGHWWTPKLTRAGVAGATRQRLMAARAELGRPITVSDIELSALPEFTAVVACNSVGDAISVSRIAEQCFVASSGLARQANALLRDSE